MVNPNAAAAEKPVKTVSTIGQLKSLEKTSKAVFAKYDSGEATIEISESGVYHLSVAGKNGARKSFATVEQPGNLDGHLVSATRDEVSSDFDNATIDFIPGQLTLAFKPKDGSHPFELTEIQFSDSGLTAKFDIHGARKFYGLGEKTFPFNKFGIRSVMWNSDFPAYSTRFDPLYESIPFILKADTSGAYGLFFDNTYRTSFDIGASDSDQISYRASGGALELYVITGKNAVEVVKKFSDLTGRMPMPPIWALGYQQSRWSYYPEKKVLDLAHGFRDRNIPCDVIYLDINYMDGYKCFTWSPKDFPGPREMLDTLHQMGFKVVTIIDPGIKDQKGYPVYDSGIRNDVFVKKPDGNYFVGQVWPGDCVFPDFLNEKTRQWWGDQYKPLVEFGVDGFWNDMNEPSVFNSPNKTFPLDAIHHIDDERVEHAEAHNVYGMQMARGTREGLERIEPGKRPLVLTRANYAGGQRYAAMWTGDNFASYAHLRLALEMFLNIGVCGQPFVGSDVGGFVGNPDAELFSRWLELGAFSPFFRTHSVIDSKPREPWAYDSTHTEKNRDIINRRYELMPEIYTAFRNANLNGLPIVRPLYLDYSDDGEVYDLSDEFLFGDKLLIAPVLDSGVTKRQVYLPQNNNTVLTWASFYDGKRLRSGWHEVDAPLGKTPVFVREGTILFSQSDIQSTTERADTLFISVYGETNASGNVYFDDGESMSYKNGDFLNLSVALKADGNASRLTFTRRGNFMPNYKFLVVQMKNPDSMPFMTAELSSAVGRVSQGGRERVRENLIRFVFPFDVAVRTITMR